MAGPKKGAMRHDCLDNRPFRDLCLRTLQHEDLSWAELAERAGYVYNGKPDCSKLQRVIGLRAHHTGVQRGLTYEVAVRIVRACGAHPVDYGV